MESDQKMFDLDAFIARHGEVVAQAIVENVERFNGIRHDAAISLEERWRMVIAAPETYAVAA